MVSSPNHGESSSIDNGAPTQRRHAQPRSLGEALREAAGISLDSSGPGSDTPSEEDYDENNRPSYTHPRQKRNPIRKIHHHNQQPHIAQEAPDHHQQSPRNRKLFKADIDVSSALHTSLVRDGSVVRIYAEDDKTLRELLERRSESARNPDKARKQRRKFRDHLFTHQFSAFDPHNAAAANSPFHGFYTLFWLAVALFMLKTSVNNWIMYGTPFGSNEIMNIMFHRDGELWLIMAPGTLSHFAGDWPWTHTVFFVLHGLVMLMKQHSYAFYNGYLSTVYTKRLFFASKLQQLEKAAPSETTSSNVPTVSSLNTSNWGDPPSASAQRRHSLARTPSNEESDIDKIASAIASHEPLDDEQIHVFERILKWKVDALADELRGTASDAGRAYPHNLTFLGHDRFSSLFHSQTLHVPDTLSR
ncbi:hypothetical protein E4U58_002504 [Claviceps cyperi]|nr:hypothetical protein E4U58_002504 [Claviceps cyperi]